MSVDATTEQPAHPSPAAPPALAAVVLAAGLGKRMRSRLPKVLHPLVGQPLIVHVLRALRAAGAHPHRAGGRPRRRAGAGHRRPGGRVCRPGASNWAPATPSCRPARCSTARSTRCWSSTAIAPLIRADTLQQMSARIMPRPGTHVTMLTCLTATPYGYGRIIRDAQGRVARHRRGARGDRRGSASARSTAASTASTAPGSGRAWPRCPSTAATGEIFLTDMMDLAVREEPGSVQTLTIERPGAGGGHQQPGATGRGRAPCVRDRIPRPLDADEGVTHGRPAHHLHRPGRDDGPGHDLSSRLLPGRARRASAPIA